MRGMMRNAKTRRHELKGTYGLWNIEYGIWNMEYGILRSMFMEYVYRST